MVINTIPMGKFVESLSLSFPSAQSVSTAAHNAIKCVCGESWAKERVWDTSGTLSNPHPVNQVFMSHISPQTHTHFFILSLVFSLHKSEGRIKETHNADMHETSGPFYKKINRGPTKKREGERERLTHVIIFTH